MIAPSCHADLNRAAFAVGERLSTSFEVHRQRPAPCVGHVPIGVEIEVPWSSYFPTLWTRFGLDRRRFRDLSPTETLELSAVCSKMEQTLLPRLQRTVDCGVPRGNDRYWEFALDPAYDVTLLTHQVEMLSATGLLPRARRHSLQITLGDVRATADVYYLAMLLELQAIDAHRITFGLDQARGIVHTGWARKGQAGVLQKGASDLKNGSTVGCELRMLQLPQEPEAFEQLMRDASFGANAIVQIQAGTTSALTHRWNDLVHHLQQTLENHGLPARRWNDRGLDHDVWVRFAERLPHLLDTVRPVFDRIRAVA